MKWTRPYFDCGRSNEWKFAAVVPVVDIHPRHTRFRHIEYPVYTAAAVMELNFDRIDINQVGCLEGCPLFFYRKPLKIDPGKPIEGEVGHTNLPGCKKSFTHPYQKVPVGCQRDIKIPRDFNIPLFLAKSCKMNISLAQVAQKILGEGGGKRNLNITFQSKVKKLLN